jgi:uncharacterized repeat protein (TIGR04076 family)
MMAAYKIRITVDKIKGKGICSLGLKKGDRFWFNEKKGGFCAWAQNAIFPFVAALSYGASFPWEKNPDVAHACCPDPDNTVVFKIERVRKGRKERHG